MDRLGKRQARENSQDRLSVKTEKPVASWSKLKTTLASTTAVVNHQYSSRVVLPEKSAKRVNPFLIEEENLLTTAVTGMGFPFGCCGEEVSV